MRVILDSNIVIAAVAARGLCESLVELCLEHHEIILCEGILKEIEEKLTGKLRVALPIARQYLEVLRNNASLNMSQSRLNAIFAGIPMIG